MKSMKDYYTKRYAETESNMAKIISDMAETIDLLQHENDRLMAILDKEVTNND